MKKIVQTLIINKDYELSDFHKRFIEIIKKLPKIYKIKFISRGNKSTQNFRKYMEAKIEKIDNVIILEIYHITIDINYLENLSSRKILLIVQNNSKPLSEYYNILPNTSYPDIKLFEISYISQEKKSLLNRLLKTKVQKIGRDKKKEKQLSKGKEYTFGRPKRKLGISQYDRDKNIIRYRLKKGMTSTQIHNELGYGSITALKNFIKTRYRKKY